MAEQDKELAGRVKYLEKTVDELDLALQDLKRDLEFIEDIIRDYGIGR